jgi:hypothetical protein
MSSKNVKNLIFRLRIKILKTLINIPENFIKYGTIHIILVKTSNKKIIFVGNFFGQKFIILAHSVEKISIVYVKALWDKIMVNFSK